MQLVILAGGKGSRLRSVTGELPKPLVDICGTPLLGRILEYAAHSGVVDRVLILTGHGGDQIAAYVRDGSQWRIPVTCLMEAAERGTAGAIYDALAQIDRRFILVYADTMLDVDLARLVRFHETRKADATLFVHPNDHPADSDLVETNDDAHILKFHPYPHPAGTELANLVNAALYVIERDALKGLAGLPGRPDFGKHVFPAMLTAGRALIAYRSPEYIKDAGTPDRLDAVRRDFVSGRPARRSLRTKTAAVFLDRDGVLNHDTGFISRAEDFRLFDNAAAAVARLNKSDYRAIVVTNQPVIARGETTFDELRRIHARMDSQLAAAGAFVDALYYCPHRPKKGDAGEIAAFSIDCDCRKPKTALIERAAYDFNLDLQQSFMVGDTTTDVELARRGGLRSILVRTGAAGKDGKFSAVPDHVVPDISGAVDLILSARAYI